MLKLFWCIFLSSLHECYGKVLYVKSWGRGFTEGGLDVSSESQAPLYLRPPLFQFSFLGCNGDVN